MKFFQFMSQTARAITGLFTAVFFATPVLAHHAISGRTPANGFEGFISGLAHPIIGLDHFVFVVAIGLLAATQVRGIGLPIAFVLMALAGTGLHLMELNLPLPEVLISASVLGVGILLTLSYRPNLLLLTGLSMIAGLFHGYAYGESIIGAEMTPLLSYLLGFTAIQLGIAMGAFSMGKLVLAKSGDLPLRQIGFIVCGAGAAFLSAAIGG